METYAVIGGSNGFKVFEDENIAYESVGALDTPFGESQRIYRIAPEKTPLLFYISRHGDRGYTIAAPFVNYRANIYALKMLGVTRIIGWSGPGAIKSDLRVGEFVLPHDLIDETKTRVTTYYKNTGLGFIRQSPVFCPTLRDFVKRALARILIQPRDEGVYVCTEGPRLETPAEIRKFATYGGDMVGMTLVPEVFLAKELEMCYHPLCYITNYAEGVRVRAYKKGELFEGLLTDDEKRAFDTAVETLPRFVRSLVTLLHEENIYPKDTCGCRQSMERYRLRGQIDATWWKDLRDTER